MSVLSALALVLSALIILASILSALIILAPILSTLIRLVPIIPAQNIAPIVSTFRYFITRILATFWFLIENKINRATTKFQVATRERYSHIKQSRCNCRKQSSNTNFIEMEEDPNDIVLCGCFCCKFQTRQRRRIAEDHVRRYGVEAFGQYTAWFES